MAKIQIKSIFNDFIIFEFKKLNNTIKDTVEQAVKNEVNLQYANLRGADLRGADLRGADMSGADLRGADLRGAKLDAVNLNSANLCGANLDAVDLYFTSLYGADLRGVIFNNTYNKPSYIAISCPSDGSFIGWKKIACYEEKYKGSFLLKLLIPEDAKRCSSTSMKCRCDKAKVLEITNIDTGEIVDVITNTSRTRCVYKVGEMVYPDSFDEDRWNECSHGIHFFIDKQSAIYY